MYFYLYAILKYLNKGEFGIKDFPILTKNDVCRCSQRLYKGIKMLIF